MTAKNYARLAGYRRHDNFNPLMGQWIACFVARWACLAQVLMHLEPETARVVAP
jgi:hypothetical protein